MDVFHLPEKPDKTQEKEFSPLSSEAPMQPAQKRLRFGTAGLRGLIAEGCSAINSSTIQLLAQAVCACEKEEGAVFIGGDHRETSSQYASVLARTIATFSSSHSRNWAIYLFSETIATPILAFACKNSLALTERRCAFGLIVTASHNSREYNGVKVYDSAGCQIRAKREREIEAEMASQKVWASLASCPASLEIYQKTVSLYRKTLLASFGKAANGHTAQVVYTPLHGVGQKFIDMATASLGLPAVVSVPSQREEDGTFPTLRFPNPEDGAVAFEEAFKIADQKGLSLVFSSDPDVDRFCFAEKQSGAWRVFTGNEIAAFLFHSLCRSTSAETERVVVSSFTASLAFSAMAAAEGLCYVETEAGFKNIAYAAREQALQGKRVLFAFEDSLGYMLGDSIWEKDGISVLCFFYFLAIRLSGEGKTFGRHLEEIQQAQPAIATKNWCYLAETKKELEEHFAAASERLQGKASLLWQGEDFSLSKNDKSALVLRSKATRIIFRKSGTEPKLKIYCDSATAGGIHRAEQLCVFLFNPSGAVLGPAAKTT